ncbi:MAG: hypothetical protein AABZ55_11045 [Bdellovibrionota bacterium]
MAEDISSKAADLVKKILTVGVGAVFLTEESVRSLVTEFKLPKELLGAVLESAGRSKKEFLQNLSQDVLSKIGEKVDLAALLQEIMSKNEIDLQIKINFSPKEKSSKKSSA